MSNYAVTLQGRPEPIEVGKIICIGRNYAAHIEELKNERPKQPMFFIKPRTSLQPIDAPIHIPPYAKECRHELELAALVGKPLKNCAAEDVLPAIIGWGVALDLTLVDIQEQCKKKGHPWEIAKGFDGACPCSPFVPADSVADAMDLTITMKVNGETRQHAGTHLMLWDIPTMIADASRYFTIEPGDIFLTGTPAGVGSLCSGDRLEMSIEGVGAYTGSVA